MGNSLYWKIYWADLSPVIGSEQAGYRPVLIVSTDDSNDFLPNVTVLPLTTYKGGAVYPNEALLPASGTGLPHDSIALGHQIRTISKRRLARQAGEITDAAVRASVLSALRVYLGL